PLLTPAPGAHRRRCAATLPAAGRAIKRCRARAGGGAVGGQPPLSCRGRHTWGRPARGTPMTGSVTLFRIRGIPIQAHPSWLLILALLTWNLAVGYFPQVLPDVPVGALWIKGLIAALLLFASVFLHELAHSFVALRYGIPVSSITLHIFG